MITHSPKHFCSKSSAPHFMFLRHVAPQITVASVCVHFAHQHSKHSTMLLNWILLASVFPPSLLSPLVKKKKKKRSNACKVIIGIYKAQA